MLLCSISIFITSPFVHYFLPCLPDFNNLSFCFLWLSESYFTFSILPRSPYYSKPCSIKSSWFVLTSPACNCCLPLQNTTHLCLPACSKLRTPLILNEGATHKLKPSPSVPLMLSPPSVLALHSTPHSLPFCPVFHHSSSNPGASQSLPLPLPPKPLTLAQGSRVLEG